jgi:hypothetical protein
MRPPLTVTRYLPTWPDRRLHGSGSSFRAVAGERTLLLPISTTDGILDAGYLACTTSKRHCDGSLRRLESQSCCPPASSAMDNRCNPRTRPIPLAACDVPLNFSAKLRKCQEFCVHHGFTVSNEFASVHVDDARSSESRHAMPGQVVARRPGSATSGTHRGPYQLTINK